MALIHDITIKMDECENQMYKMCKVRTNEQRNCASSKCCGICYQVTYCKGVCKYLKGHFLDLGKGDDE